MKKTLTLVLLTVLVTSLFSTSVFAGSQWFTVGGGWKYRLDTPDSAKPYHHIHIYKDNKEVLCWNLKDWKPCDKGKGSYDKLSDLPKKVQNHIADNSKVQKIINDYHPTDSWLDKIPKWALVTVAALAVFLATISWFFPGDDVAAWALFLRAIA